MSNCTRSHAISVTFTQSNYKNRKWPKVIQRNGKTHKENGEMEQKQWW